MTFLNQNITKLTLLIFFSFGIGLLLTPASIWISKKLDIIDYPGKSVRRIHKKPVPRAGGIAIILSLIVTIAIFRLWNLTDIWHIYIPAVVIFAFGLWDDKHGMEAPTKLIGQVLAVTILVYFDIRVKFLESQSFFIQLNDTLAYWLDIGITYFWMVGITNAFNMVDSMDGLAIGLCQTISAFFLFLAIVLAQNSLMFLSAAIFGISCAVVFYNRKPAKTFLGDSGAQSLGFMLAAIAILYRPQVNSQASSWFAPVMFFTIPIFDTSLVTFARLKRGLPFYKANLDHTYHRLVRLGCNKSQAVAIMQISGIVIAFASVGVVYLPPFAANMVFALWVIIFIIMIFLLEKKFAPYYPDLENS